MLFIGFEYKIVNLMLDSTKLYLYDDLVDYILVSTKMNLRPLYLKKGLTKKQTATAIGVSDKTLWMWDCGKSIPSGSYLVALADLLGPEVYDLYRQKELA